MMDAYAYQQSIKYIEDDGGPKNLELAKRIYPYTKLVIQLIFVTRVILFLLSLKWMKVSKLFFYFE